MTDPSVGRVQVEFLSGQRAVGRTVMISFDTAWPILQAHDFIAATAAWPTCQGARSRSRRRARGLAWNVPSAFPAGIAAPFGEGDDRFVRLARACGYKAGFTLDPGHAALGRDALRLTGVA